MMLDDKYISRKLLWTGPKGEEQIIQESELYFCDIQCPIVILGDSGMGKTELMEKLGEADCRRYFRAASFLRQENDKIQADLQLIIDGLDEVAAKEQGDPLHNVIKKLNSCGSPPFIIACRSAEWRGLAARYDIEEEYGCRPRELHLQPLSKSDAIEILACEIDETKARESIERLCLYNIETFYENPLNLRFVASTLKREEALPESRSELLDKATITLCQEHNDDSVNNLKLISTDKIRDIAGCIMAVMLLAGKDGIRRSNTESDDFILSLSEISDLTDVELASNVLSTRLFRLFQDSSNETYFFTPLHRTVAEYLGARWLAQHVEDQQNVSRVARRLLGLISAEGGVPVSLRGLYAWLPKFSPKYLGSTVIEQDPLGVLRYGDGDHLTTDQAKHVIQEIRRKANLDSTSSFGYWNVLSTKGLVQTCLAYEIRSIVQNPEEPLQLRLLMLDAIDGEEIAMQLKHDLLEIVLNRSRDYDERERAFIALVHALDGDFNWPAELGRLSDLGDDDSNRLVIKAILEVGIENFGVEQITNAVIAYVSFSDDTDRASFSPHFRLLSYIIDAVSLDRINPILDQLTSIVSSRTDPESWWQLVEPEVWQKLLSRLSRTLTLRLLEDDPDSVQSEQLWSWIRSLWTEQERRYLDDRFDECDLICQNDALRLDIQRLALFGTDEESNFQIKVHRLKDICNSFWMSDEDAKIHLAELVERNNLSERSRWFYLVGRFRKNHESLIPTEIQRMARPYAEGDTELVDFLTEKPKSDELSEYERKYREEMKELKQQREQELENTRSLYFLNIDDVRRGELKWILGPAQAYLGMFSDLESDCVPSDRISQWLGEKIKDASLEGFEAVLHRSDLPTTKQIVDEYAKSRYWNYSFPMLAAVGQRHLMEKGIRDLSIDLVKSLAIIADHELSISNDYFSGLKDALNDHLREDSRIFESYLRQKFEPMLASDISHIPGLYSFVRDDCEYPLSQRLCLEWLDRIPALPMKFSREIIHCVIHAPKPERQQAWSELARIATNRLIELEQLDNGAVSDKKMVWWSVQFLINFEAVEAQFPNITEENKQWLWELRDLIYDQFHQNERTVPITINQLRWLVMNFRQVWPKTNPPEGVRIGTTNCWDATEFLEWSIDQIAKEASDEAASALSELNAVSDDSYKNFILSAIEHNKRMQIDAKFEIPTIAQIRAVLSDDLPNSDKDVQCIVLEALSMLQNRLRGHQLDPVNNFYDDGANPKSENQCRDQMLLLIESLLPFGIKYQKEARMPQERLSDVSFQYGNFEVPVETKGQWHRDVWTAAEDQLDLNYCASHKPGIYVVFWFGENVPKKKKITSRRDKPKPQSPEHMREELRNTLPATRRSDVEVVVLDVSRQ